MTDENHTNDSIQFIYLFHKSNKSIIYTFVKILVEEITKSQWLDNSDPFT